MSERSRRGFLVAGALVPGALCAGAPCAGAFAAQDDAAERAAAWLAHRAVEASDSPREDVAAVLLAFLQAAGVPGSARDGAAAGAADRHAVQVAMADSILRSAYANWLTGFASLYLAEESLRTGEPHPAWPRVLDALSARQNVEGGFGHGGPQALASFYPTTLVAATAWALLAHGLARLPGRGADAGAPGLADALALLADVQAGSGAFPYGGRAYRKGPEAGRTAGVVAALAALGRRDHAAFGPAARYLQANWTAVPDGHASPAMHVLFGALAAQSLGEPAWRAFDERVLARVRAAQRPDGSFDDVVAGSPDSLGLIGGEAGERAYRTACYAAALALPRSRLGRALGAHAPRDGGVPVRGDAPPAGAGAVRWARQGAVADALVAATGDVWLVDAAGLLHRLARADGRPLGKPRRAVPAALAGATRLAHAGEGLFLVTLPGAPAAEGALAHEAENAPDVVTRVRAVRADGTVLPPVELHGSPVASGARGKDLCLLLRGGAAVRVPAGGGEPRVLVRMPPAAVNACLLPLEGGGLLCAVESGLTVFDASGAEAWHERTPRRRGMTPAAWTAACTPGGLIVAGATDGEVVAWSAEDGGRRWSIELGTAVRGLAPAGPASVLASCWDGSLRRIEAGAEAWRASVARGREVTAAGGFAVDGDVAWVQTACVLVALRAADGAELGRWPLGAGRFAAGHGVALAFGPGGLRCLAADG